MKPFAGTCDFICAAETDLSGRRLLIVEEALRNYVGHWFEYVNSVAKINEGAGVQVTVAAHRQIDKQLGSPICAHGAFAKTNCDRLCNSPAAFTLYIGTR